MNPKPITLSYMDPIDYTGAFDPQPMVVIGEEPAGGGAPGPQGEKGDPGPEGPRGQDGAAGQRGPEGAEGPRGAQGERGEAGTNGIAGAKGDKGDTGATGAPGQSITIAGYLDTIADLEALALTLGPEDAGKSYVTMEFGHLHFWTGTEFTDGGAIVGPQGAQGTPGTAGAKGDKGDTGAKGDKGDEGPRGLQGVKGDTGAKGDAGTGLPPGGLTGQHIRKRSDADGDTEWVQQRFVESGDLNTGPLHMDMSGMIRFTLERTGTSTARASIRSLDGNRRIDFKRYSIFDSAALEGNYADDYLLTETPWVFDTIVYTHTRESPIMFVRDIATLTVWKLETFISGNGTRTRVWAERID